MRLPISMKKSGGGGDVKVFTCSATNGQRIECGFRPRVICGYFPGSKGVSYAYFDENGNPVHTKGAMDAPGFVYTGGNYPGASSVDDTGFVVLTSHAAWLMAVGV